MEAVEWLVGGEAPRACCDADARLMMVVMVVMMMMMMMMMMMV
jgi:hypothetical protein